MKFVLKNTLGESIVTLMRKVNYHFLDEKEGAKLSFYRPLAPAGYPRFHLYLKVNSETKEIFCNLHLDQKKPIYKRAPAHSAEYEGKAIKKEMERIKSVL